MTDRTPEEREAARLERERRRSVRGESGGGEVTPPPAPEPESREPEPAYGSEPALEPAFVAGDPYTDDGDPYTDEHEIPSGVRRVTRAQRPPARRPELPKRGRAPRKPVASQSHGRRRLIGRLAAVLAIAVVIAALWFLDSLFQPFHGAAHGRITVTIPPHEGASQIGTLLAKEGVVDSGFFFNLRAALDGDRGKLRAGTYHMQLGMSYSDALKILTTPPVAAPTSELTIAEGDTRAKVSALLHAQHVRGNYLAETRRSPLLNPRAYGAPRNLPSLEGFLFPSTYQLVDPIRMSALIADQLKTFKQRFATVNFAYARSKHLTPFDVLTIASIVQGEAQTLHDMPLIASVIYNRLHDGMLLGMDSTTRYAVGNFTTPLTVSQLSNPSPYNTRVHAGLPLGPINNPGMAAIQAAAHPANTNYLYFVAKPCGNGASVFTGSYSQFQQYVAQYQNARAARGGKSPTHC